MKRIFVSGALVFEIKGLLFFVNHGRQHSITMRLMYCTHQPISYWRVPFANEFDTKSRLISKHYLFLQRKVVKYKYNKYEINVYMKLFMKLFQCFGEHDIVQIVTASNLIMTLNVIWNLIYQNWFKQKSACARSNQVAFHFKLCNV